MPAPVAYSYLGASIPPAGSTVPNFSGGLVVDNNGLLYAASNPPIANTATVVYTCNPTVTPVTWTNLPPIAAYDYNGVGIQSGTIAGAPFWSADCANNVTNLQSDNQGRLYVQWNEPGTSAYTNLSFPNTPIP